MHIKDAIQWMQNFFFKRFQLPIFRIVITQKVMHSSLRHFRTLIGRTRFRTNRTCPRTAVIGLRNSVNLKLLEIANLPGFKSANTAKVLFY